LQARKPKDLNRIATFSTVHICLMKENLTFKYNYMT
jgi:hypothetical protein